MKSQNAIRVLLADDHAMVRSGLRMFLLAFDDFELVGEASNGMEAARLAIQLEPDVILMDLIMPGLDGIHATKEIHSKNPQIGIIALTSFTDPQLIRDALEAGVSGYLFKSVSAGELASAIRSVHAGNSILAPEVTQALIHTTTEPVKIDLTPREYDVLELMVDGKTNAEISEVLTLSLSTVKFHVSNILSKLDVRSRSEAILFSLKNHLINSQNEEGTV